MQLRRDLKNKNFADYDFRTLLQEELTARCRSNPNYSLRSFARALGVEPSALSQIINKKRPITQKMKLRLGSALGLSVHQLEKIPAAGAPRFQTQTLDAFALISDWYHYAILELTHVEGFEASSLWISRRLGITKSEANIAVERLFRMGLLEETARGQKTGVHWKDTSENGEITHLSNGLTSDAARKYQMQLLELSQRTLQEVAITKRNHTSAAFCFNRDDMESAIREITIFRRAFARKFQPKTKAQDVYQLQISFFPLTKEKDVYEK